MNANKLVNDIFDTLYEVAFFLIGAFLVGITVGSIILLLIGDVSP